MLHDWMGQHEQSACFSGLEIARLIPQPHVHGGGDPHQGIHRIQFGACKSGGNFLLMAMLASQIVALIRGIKQSREGPWGENPVICLAQPLSGQGLAPLLGQAAARAGIEANTPTNHL